MKIRSLAFILGIIWLYAPCSGSVIAVVDSGLDIEHEYMIDHIWSNPVDYSINLEDEDGNGYRDDIHGWNFFGSNNQLFDPKYSDLLNDDVQKYFLLQGQGLKGKLNQKDAEWVNEMRKNEEFVSRLQKFGNFAHGTHVTGLAVSDSPKTKALTVRLVPVENPLEKIIKDVDDAVAQGKGINFILKHIIKGGLFLLAKAQAQPFGQIGAYIGAHKAQVANVSLGTGSVQAKALIRPLLKLVSDPIDPVVLDELAHFFIERVTIEQRVLVDSAPSTLFVFAAGNDGVDTVKSPISPANIKSPHAITVGASYHDKIASFSNFGDKVDLLAPGVAALGPVPGNNYLPLSGTSQAAPRVAGVAAGLIDINPKLSAVQLRQIMISTVDIIPDLKGK